MIVQHMHGNMLSRWTNFLETDGEKEWRNRDREFEAEVLTKDRTIEMWNEGWSCLFAALDSITDKDLDRVIYIRAEPHTVQDAIHRQLAHYPLHVGQILYIGKMICSDQWQSLSIPKGGSQAFNDKMMKV